MADLNMPPGLTDDQRRQWLREVGAALAEETGQPSGQTEQFENADGETSWIMWWTDEEYNSSSLRTDERTDHHDDGHWDITPEPLEHATERHDAQ